MDIRIQGAPTGGTVRAIPSKSAAHRMMIAAALSGTDLQTYCEGLSQDISATRECLRILGGMDRHGEPAQLPCGESGSTLRFLIPLAGVLGIDADLICEGRLPDRPMGPFLSALAQHGCRVEGHNPKRLRGRLQGGKFTLPGDISSQFVTGLLMALPLADTDSSILIEGTLQSRPYIDMTLQTLAKAGIRVEEGLETGSAGKARTVFDVPGQQSYRLPASELDQIEGDWSNAAFWLVMDAMLKRQEGNWGPNEPRRIRCVGLDPDSMQGDRAIVSLIERMDSADALFFSRERDSASTRSGPDISVAGRSGFVEIDASQIPDLVPILAAYACGRPRGTVTHIANAGRLRMKESDRLFSVTRTLTALGGDVTEEAAGLMIRGRGSLEGGRIDSFGDHRIVMMGAACACISRDDVLIRCAEAVNKSYPGFFEDYRKLGAVWEEVSL